MIIFLLCARWQGCPYSRAEGKVTRPSNVGVLILPTLPSEEEAKVLATCANKGQDEDLSPRLSNPIDVAFRTGSKAQRLNSLSLTTV